MEFSRESYWNVGHGASTLVPMYLFSFLAVALLVNEARRRVLAYQQGKPLNRVDQLPVRIRLLLVNLFLQSQARQVRGLELAHALFFWGFFILFLGSGRILAEETLGSRINQKRVKMAAATGQATLVSNCPFCLTMFEDGIKGAELEGQLEPKDIAEILAERL